MTHKSENLSGASRPAALPGLLAGATELGELLPEGVWLVDLAMRTLYVNPRMAELLGYSVAEMLGRHVTEFHAAEQLEQVVEGMRRRRAGETTRLDFRFRRKDGTSFWGRVAAAPVRDAAGRIVASLGVITDISDRKRVEEELRAGEQRYRTLADNVTDMITRHDLSGVCLYVSPACRAITGYEPEELLGVDAYKLLHPEEVTLIHQHHMAILAGPVHRTARHRLRRKDGSYAWVETTGRAVRDQSGAPLELVMVIRDITERIQAEEALAESNRLARNIVDALQAHIAILDAAGTILSVNRAWQEFAERHGVLGCRAAVGVNYLAVCDAARGVYADEAPLAAAGIREVLAGRREDFALEYACHDEREQRWFMMRVTRFAGPGPTRVVVAHENVTERKLAEAAAQHHQAQLAHLARVTTVGQLASGLAHELNQPLGAIANYAGASLAQLQSGRPVPPMVLEALQEVVRETGRAGEIIQRVRQFVRKQAPRRAPVDLNALVEESLRLMAAETRRASARVVLELTGEAPQVLADAVQIQQVVVNLVQNALDAMVRTPPAQRVVSVSTAVEGPAARVWVSDAGEGVPAEAMGRIFDAFYTSKADGLGMGLTLSRSIIDAHGGHLEMAGTGASGRGARFGFTLPLVAPGAPAGVASVGDTA